MIAELALAFIGGIVMGIVIVAITLKIIIKRLALGKNNRKAKKV
jgi:hypothetical protein